MSRLKTILNLLRRIFCESEHDCLLYRSICHNFCGTECDHSRDHCIGHKLTETRLHSNNLFCNIHLILNSHLRLQFTSGPFPSGLKIKIFYLRFEIKTPVIITFKVSGMWHRVAWYICINVSGASHIFVTWIYPFTLITKVAGSEKSVMYTTLHDFKF